MHLLSALFITALLRQASALETVVGLYGETLEIPCNNGAIKEDVLITKWKYDKGVGVSGDLLTRGQSQDVSVTADDEYKGRVSMAANASLMVSEARLTDQRTFTCMVVVGGNIAEYPVNVEIYKTPAGVEISEKAAELEIGKLTKLGTCVVKDANPPAKVTWLKNNKPLVADGRGISIQESAQQDPITGLSTTTSTLEYSAEKEDADAEFKCSTQPKMSPELVSSLVKFSITYSTENIVLEVHGQQPVVEGQNVTLKCVADGNPAPTSFNFYIKGEMIRVDSNNYMLTDIGREATGEYKCSLIDNPLMEASQEITVNYLDINLSPAGDIVKRAGEALELNFRIDASGDSKVTWRKNNVILDKEPQLNKLTFSDSGRYECEVRMGPLSRKASFELLVEGPPVIRKLSKLRSKDGKHKVLSCEVEGSPKPSVSWSINGTSHESPFINGQITYKITVVPTENLTVSCVVNNQFGRDSEEIEVLSHQSGDYDQTKLVVGVVVGLLVACVVIGLIYWIYAKKSKQGSWKTGEKENGSSEEERKLEEKVEENSQKAEV
ncbi:CD166 antigen homolog isoform X2 [Synchiropus splendidus]|uniref:CD166 antigen homolog isoform X2 n=1 Tax=Synchiropus splendidus TaxID=270530 RepID=UPI00237EDCA8|nr:CD166 antigen homolog isoform X2 [Synchiropus splendidus]